MAEILTQCAYRDTQIEEIPKSWVNMTLNKVKIYPQVLKAGCFLLMFKLVRIVGFIGIRLEILRTRTENYYHIWRLADFFASRMRIFIRIVSNGTTVEKKLFEVYFEIIRVKNGFNGFAPLYWLCLNKWNHS